MTEQEGTQTGWRRNLKVGMTAAKVSGKLAQKKTHNLIFNNDDYSKNKEEEIGDIVLLALGQLKGLALKGAQLLGQEIELIPEPIRVKLQKSFNQAPILNRAIVRKMIKSNLEQDREDVFSKLDEKAVAAASLGQVHRATLVTGEKVAVKLQYPGVSTSVKGDLKIIKMLMKQFISAAHFESTFEELETRLLEEVDYLNEAKNINWYHDHIKEIKAPKVYTEFSSDKMLVMEWVDGLCLHEWIESNPTQEQRDKLAQRMWDMFIESCYENLCLHADPNPANFIITADDEIVLIDFGCVKHFTREFMNKLTTAFPESLNSPSFNPIPNFLEVGLLIGDDEGDLFEEHKDDIVGFNKHVRKPYHCEVFDFGANDTYIQDGFKLSSNLRNAFKDMHYASDVIFMDRVRYGYMRLFHQMKAKVKIRNKYEMGKYY